MEGVRNSNKVRSQRSHDEPIRVNTLLSRLKTPLDVDREDRILFRLDRWMFGELPESYPLRAKINIKMQTSKAGMVWDMFQTGASILACVLYVVETYNVNAPSWLNWSLTAVFTADMLLRFYAAENRFRHLLKFYTIVDILTVAPEYVDAILSYLAYQLATASLTFFRFARILKLMRIVRAFKLTNQQRQLTREQRQFAILGLTVTSLLFLSAGAVQMVEKMDFGTALYFMVVTISTVGYGDVHATTSQGQLVVSLIIITTWILVPLQLSKLYQVLSSRSKFKTTVPRKKPHVLVVGDVLNTFKIQKFISEFYHPDRSVEERRVRLVLVGPNEPSREIKELMVDPVLDGRVSYVKASVMKEHDLDRVAADEAHATFVLSDWLSGASEVEDSKAVVRCLMINNYNPRMPCYVQLSDPASSFQLSLSPNNTVLCSDSLKMAILGLSVAHPGCSTLLTNIMTSSMISRDTLKAAGTMSQRPWMPQYLEGTAYELYMAPIPRGFDSWTFPDSGGHLTLLGIQEQLANPSADKALRPPVQLLCNPGPRYYLRIDTTCVANGVFMASDSIELEYLKEMDLLLTELALGKGDKLSHAPPETPITHSAASTVTVARHHDTTAPGAALRDMGLLEDPFPPFPFPPPPLSLLTGDADAPSPTPIHAHGTPGVVSHTDVDVGGVGVGGAGGAGGGTLDEQAALETQPSLQGSEITPASVDMAHTGVLGAHTGVSDPHARVYDAHSGVFGGTEGGSVDALRATMNTDSSASMPLPQRPQSLPTERRTRTRSIEDALHGLRASNECLHIMPDRLQRVPADTLRELEGHVIVISQWANMSSLAHLIAPLRTASCEGPSVVIMLPSVEEGGMQSRTDNGPASGSGKPQQSASTARVSKRHKKGLKKIMEELRRFGDIYITEGDASTDDQLSAAGLEQAACCVMLADKTSTKMVDGHFVDNAILRKFLSVQKFLVDQERSHADFSYLVEVQSSSTLKIMNKYQAEVRAAAAVHALTASVKDFKAINRRQAMLSAGSIKNLSEVKTPSLHHKGGVSDDNQDIPGVTFNLKESYTLPFFASGHGFLTHMFDTLPCQAYYSRDLVRFLELLVGHVIDSELDAPPLPHATSSLSSSKLAVTTGSIAAGHNSGGAVAVGGGGCGGGGGGGSGGSGSSGRGVSLLTANSGGVSSGVSASQQQLQQQQQQQRSTDSSMRPIASALSSSIRTAASIDTQAHSHTHAVDPNFPPARLSRIQMPVEFLSSDAYEEAPTFGALLEWLVRNRAMVPIGLYRHCEVTGQRYVATGPKTDSTVRPEDWVFVITPQQDA